MIHVTYSGVIFAIIALSGCFGILLVGALVFGYLYLRSSRRLHCATLMIVIPGMVFVGSEISVLVLGITNQIMAALQMHRIQAIASTSFLFTVPLFFGNFLFGSPLWNKLNKIVMYAGLCVFVGFTVAAFAGPDLFLSVTHTRPDTLGPGWGLGRGRHGLLFIVRDAMLFLMVCYCLVSIIIDYMKRKKDVYLMYVLGGVIVAVVMALYDIFYYYGFIHRHVSGYANYSLAGFGFTIFITLSMAEVLRQFLDKERELEQARKLESLGIFAGGIAHDFNNFLTSIMGSISIVKKRMVQGTREYMLLDEAERASKRARGLIQQLMTFSRGGAPVRERVALLDLLHEAVDFDLVGANVRCEYDLSRDLWDMYADRGQMGQVLYNLVLNARQASASGEAVLISAHNELVPDRVKPQRSICIQVQDRGEGISSKRLKHIFDPYYTTKKDGSGLGLSIAHSIVRKHGGDITIRSREGEGTTVDLRIPAFPESVERERVPAVCEAALSGKRVLLMDDDAMICEVSSEMLRILGYSVASASSGEEAVSLYKKAGENGEPFDCVIMDLTVHGGMDGLEALRILREYDPQCRAIVSSGYSDDPVMADYRKYGFAGICPKPYGIDVLEAVLSDILKD